MSVWVFVVILTMGGESHYGVGEGATKDECNAKRAHNVLVAKMRGLPIEQSDCVEMRRPLPTPGAFDDGDGPAPQERRGGNA